MEQFYFYIPPCATHYKANGSHVVLLTSLVLDNAATFCQFVLIMISGFSIWSNLLCTLATNRFGLKSITVQKTIWLALFQPAKVTCAFAECAHPLSN